MSNPRSSWWAGLSAAFLLVACGGAATPPPVSPEAVTEQSPVTEEAEEALVAPGEAKLGDKTRCLVSGHSFVVDESSPKVEHEGKTYFFCCPGCDDKFSSDPAHFLAGTT